MATINDEQRATAAKLVVEIEEQEKTLRFDTFDSETAFQVGSLIRARFLARQIADKGIVISISLFTGHTLFASAAGDDEKTGPDNFIWVQAKKNAVARYGHSSFYTGRKFASQGKTPESVGLNFPDFACHGGAFPIWLKKGTPSPIGVIVVSGLAQAEDHQLVVESLKEYLKL